MSAPQAAYLMKLKGAEADHLVAAKLNYGDDSGGLEYHRVIVTTFFLDEYLVIKDNQTGEVGFVGAVRIDIPSTNARHHNLSNRRGKLSLTTQSGIKYALLNDAGLNTLPNATTGAPKGTPRKNYINVNFNVKSAYYDHTSSCGIDVQSNFEQDSWKTVFENNATIPPNQTKNVDVIFDPSAVSPSSYVRYRAWAINSEGTYIGNTQGVETNGVSVFWRKTKKYLNIGDNNPIDEPTVFMYIEKYTYLTDFISGNPDDKNEIIIPSSAYLYVYTSSILNIGVDAGFYQNITNEDKVRIRIDATGKIVSFRRMGAPFFNSLTIASTLYPSTPNDKFEYMVGSVKQVGSSFTATVTFGWNNFEERTFYHYAVRINNAINDTTGVSVQIASPDFSDPAYNETNPTKLKDYTKYEITLSAYPGTGPTDWFLQIF